jgi:benzoate/toluate 1,2-dioxygenase beta subunit
VTDRWFSAYQLLTHEAALLDARAFDEWLSLYTDDATYWIPAKFSDADPTRDVSIAYDDRRRLHERVLRLKSGFAYSQDPPSRTCHTIGNVRILGDADGRLRVASNVVLVEVRRSVQTVYSGFVEHELTGDDLRIARKTVRLLNADLPLGNLTFIL